jgi:hypothetical protein
MGNDEKATLQKDDTPSPGEGENTKLRPIGQDESPLPFSAADDDADSATPEDEQPLESRYTPIEPDFGMPAFGFFHDALKQAKKAERPKDDALIAAKASLEKPMVEGTGWDNISSIANPPESMTGAPGIEMQAPAERQASQRSAATVMPFPGSAIHQRHAEPAPSEMLGASIEGREANLFDVTRAEPAEPVPEFDSAAHDTIADAVQSALRNVYGGTIAQTEDEAPDFGSITVADSLKHAAAADPGDGDDFWSDRGEQWRGDRREDVFAARSTENDTDAVLDYLYGDRRAAGGREQPFVPGDASLRNLGDALGYEREPRGRFEFDEPADRGVLGAGGRSFEDGSFGGPGRRFTDRGPQRFDSEANAEPDWGGPPFVASSASGSLPEGQYPAPLVNAESLASGSPDSSHLLGAAGLGLIGGIAIAGVLAVFVFNSVFEEVDPNAVDATPQKVIERLDSAQAEADAPAPAPRGEQQQARVEPAPERVAPQPQPAPEAQPSPRVEPKAQATLPPQRVAPPAPEPRLKAADAAGDPGRAIPLEISLTRAEDREATLISLKGLPVYAKLSTGIDIGGGQWLLPPSKLSNLTVTTPPNVAGKFDVEAELLKDDAQTQIFGPVPFKLQVGAPARDSGDATPSTPTVNTLAEADATAPSAPAEQAAQVATLSESGQQIETDFLTQMLIRDGNKLMRDGDILSARRLYEQAAATGNPEAALAMGRSYDPSYFEKLPVKTGKPDPATAFEWYKKALDGGLVTARVKIDGLKQWLQR